jgi:hypothetical protein
MGTQEPINRIKKIKEYKALFGIAMGLFAQI